MRHAAGVRSPPAADPGPCTPRGRCDPVLQTEVRAARCDPGPGGVGGRALRSPRRGRRAACTLLPLPGPRVRAPRAGRLQGRRAGGRDRR